jgi:chromosome segregation ATPase
VLEKIRLSVSGETKKVIDDITEGIEERLSAEPPWTTNLIERLEDKITAMPEWAGPIEKSLLSVVKHESAQVSKELQNLKVDVGNVIQRLDQTAAAVSEVASIINAMQSNIDMTNRELSQAIGKIETLLQTIKAGNDKTWEATSHDLSLLKTRIAEQQTMIETLVGTIQAQSLQMTRCELQLTILMKPWWKKLFGRVIC